MNEKVHKCIYVCTRTHTHTHTHVFDGSVELSWCRLSSGWRAGVATIPLVFVRGAAGSPFLLYYTFQRGACFLHKESARFLLCSIWQVSVVEKEQTDLLHHV